MSNYEQKISSLLFKYTGKGNVNVIRKYLLGFLFFKYLSEKLVITIKPTLDTYGLTFDEAYMDDKIRNTLKKDTIKKIGYFIPPQYLFHNIITKIPNKEDVLDYLNNAFQEIYGTSSNTPSQNVFSNIFDDLDLFSSELGENHSDKNELISKMLFDIAYYDIGFENYDLNALANAFSMLLYKFVGRSYKESAYSPIPQSFMELLAKLLSLNKKQIETIYNPTCGNGELLLEVSNNINVSKVYGQEQKKSLYNLTKMNLLIHGFNYNQIDIQYGNVLENPDKNHKDKKFDAIISSIPFSAKWIGGKSFLKDDRFLEYGVIAPKNKADYAYIQHMLYHLSSEGTMVVMLPLGVLFRGASEASIRKHIIEKQNCLDAVIGLPNNLIHQTDMSICILIFKKTRENKENILFIDASRQYERVRHKKIINQSQIQKIIKTYSERKEEENFSHIATLHEIKENGYNLSINKYVEISDNDINLSEIQFELNQIDKELHEVNRGIIRCCRDLMDTPEVDSIRKQLNIKGLNKYF